MQHCLDLHSSVSHIIKAAVQDLPFLEANRLVVFTLATADLTLQPQGPCSAVQGKIAIIKRHRAIVKGDKALLRVFTIRIIKLNNDY